MLRVAVVLQNNTKHILDCMVSSVKLTNSDQCASAQLDRLLPYTYLYVLCAHDFTIAKSKGSIQSAQRKFSFTELLKFKGNIPTLAETAFTVTLYMPAQLESTVTFLSWNL